MGKTYKDLRKVYQGTGRFSIRNKLKLSASTKRKTLKSETNPRVLKLKQADEWNYT